MTDPQAAPVPGGSDEAAALDTEVADLRRLVEVQRDLARRAASDAREARAQVVAARQDLARLRESFEGFRGRKSIRLAAAAAERLRPVVAATRKVRRRAPAPGRADAVVAAPPTPDEGRIAAALVEEASLPGRADGPLVSIVMLNRDGAVHLGRALPALARTAYRPIELIVVDNGSTDGSVETLAAFHPDFPVTVLRNAENRSFSDANNQGAEVAGGELLLFINNDVEPAGPHWLGPLVDAAEESGVAAAGPRLVYPAGVPGPRAGHGHADLSVQHAGVWFRMEDGMPIGAPIGVGSDPLGDLARATREAPALTAACLLVRAPAFRACGGFTPGYDYGQEDVDLCLKLHEHGWRLVYEGRAVLWHHESATRSLEALAARRARNRSNRARFVAAWGPRLYRTVMRSAIAGDGTWRAPLRVRVIRSQDAGVPPVPMPVRRGWTIEEGPSAAGEGGAGQPDVVVVGDPLCAVREMPPATVRVAWVTGDGTTWRDAPALPDYDLVLVDNGEAAGHVAAVHGLPVAVVRDGDGFVDALLGWLEARRVTVRVGIPSWDVAETWGDLHLGRDLARALRRHGRPTRLDLQPAGSVASSARDDVAIDLFGLVEAPVHPGQVNVLWHISHPDLATPELYERHDLAFVASEPFARWMRDRVNVPVAPLHQATDPERFRPRDGGPSHDLLFVANSRGIRRHILDDLLPTPHDLAVFGRGWTPERLDPARLAGEHVPNDELAAFYAGATIVLNDHWADMQREGFLSNRLYDASAAGAFVISDAVDGLREEFDGGVVAYHGRDELRALIDRYLGDPAGRAERAARARAAVLARHTIDHRAREILAAVAPLEAARPAAVVP